MRSLGQVPSEMEVQDLLNEFDSAGGGIITWEEFLIIMNRRQKIKPDSKDDLNAAFASFDSKRTGQIPVAELRRVLTTLGEPLSDAEMEELIKQADEEGSGFVKYHNFVNKIKEAH